jgi:hypothetical protein
LLEVARRERLGIKNNRRYLRNVSDGSWGTRHGDYRRQLSYSQRKRVRAHRLRAADRSRLLITAATASATDLTQIRRDERDVLQIDRRSRGARAGESHGSVGWKREYHKRRHDQYREVQRGGRAKLRQRTESATRQSRRSSDQVIEMEHIEREAKRIPAADSFRPAKTQGNRAIDPDLTRQDRRTTTAVAENPARRREFRAWSAKRPPLLILA